jgi:PAS domain S-box-containing protein
MSDEKKHLKILLVEDSDDDAELIARKLKKEGYRCDFKKVMNKKDVEISLKNDEWDLIISDYLLPRFSGEETLKLAKRIRETVPIIMVSGKIGEEKAVEMLKKGATDFVMKDNLARLPFVVDRALAEAQMSGEKREMEEELIRVADRYHLLASNISDIIWTMDTKKRFTFVSPSVLKVTGYRIKEILAKKLDEILVPEHYKTVVDAIERIIVSFENEKIEPPAVDTFEAELVCKNGSTIWTETKVSPLMSPGKRILGFLGVTRDVSERKRNERLLKESESNLRLILDSTPDAVLTTNQSGKILFINRGFSGTSVENIVGTNFFDRIINKGKIKKIFDRAWIKEEAVDLEIQDKNLRWWQARLIPIKRGGNVDRILFISSDITEEKKSEQERMNLAGVVEHLEEGIVITDASRRIRYVNLAFQSLSGFETKEILGKPVDILWEGEKSEELLESHKKTFLLEGSWKGRLTRCRKDGTRYEAHVLLSPLRGKKGKIASYIIVEREITQEVKLEEQFRRMQKMEALGTLAGGIAHDFNNILMPIIINSELLLWETPKENPQHLYLEQNLEAAARGKDLIKQILTYSRQTDIQRRPLDMIPTIKEILRFLRASLPTSIEIQQSLGMDSCIVNADPVQIQQVLMNICKNSADAIGSSKGKIDIQLKEVDVALEDQILYPDLEPGPYLDISIRDTGCGMDRETAERIFDPFFTTKNPGEGSGMGMAVVQRIVKNHGGGIGLSSEPGKGTTFQIFLPRIEAEQLNQKPMDDSIPGGKENILLVEDEKDVVLSLKKLLEKLGYNVTEMTKPLDALREVFKQSMAFDLVIVDQVMPEMSGMELAQKLKHAGMDLPVILMTGFSEGLNPQEAEDIGIKELMMKPVNSRDMAQTIRRILDGGI